MDHHHVPRPGTDDPFQDVTLKEEEDFPTAPLHDDIWLEDPVPDGHLSSWTVTATPPVFLSLSIQYGPTNHTPEDAPTSYYKMMDLSDILDIQDVITTTSDEDIPDLDIVFGLWIWTMICINIYNPSLYPHELMQNYMMNTPITCSVSAYYN